MAQTPAAENSDSENSTETQPDTSKKKAQTAPPMSTAPATETQNDGAKKKAKSSSQQTLHPVQYRAVRYVSFMLEDSKHEISPTDFIKEAVARHLVFYQTKRGIEFPNKMLAELSKLELIPPASRSEE